MIQRPPLSTRSDTLFPYPPLFRSIIAQGNPAHQVWLPPLDVPDTLDLLMPDLVVDPRLGLHSPQWRGLGNLTVPIGIVDRPREQRRDTMTVSLSGASGHAAVVGRSDERRVGKEWVSKCRSLWSPLY